MIANGGKGWRWLGIEPAGVHNLPIAYHHGVVTCAAFPFTPTLLRRFLQVGHGDIGRGNVVDGRMAGLQHPPALLTVHQRDLIHNNTDALCGRLQARRSWIIPN